MPDKIEKALRKLSEKERLRVREILVAIKAGRLDGLDIVKLKGNDDIYRIRKGDIRIIFAKATTGTTILAIERRSDTTYK